MASIPQLFKQQLSAELLSEIISFLVSQTYFEKNSDDVKQLAQFKLFGLVQILHKVKIGAEGESSPQKGLKNGKELWVAEVNHEIQK